MGVEIVVDITLGEIRNHLRGLAEELEEVADAEAIPNQGIISGDNLKEAGQLDGDEH